MTVDERVNDVMAKLHSWIEQGAHKRFYWDKERRQHIEETDEETRRAIIKIIVEVGRQDGIEAEREACAKIADLAKAECERIAPTTNEEGIFRDGTKYIAGEIAQKIRARSEGKKKGE